MYVSVYLRTLWRYTNYAVIIIIITTLLANTVGEGSQLSMLMHSKCSNNVSTTSHTTMQKKD